MASVKLSTKAVGSIVKLNINGAAKNFIVVHQGNPDASVYDASCDGTWLLMEEVYETRKWDSVNNDYGNSDIHSYLNNTFIDLFDINSQSLIKEVKIPYTNGKGLGGTLATGSSGLPARLFLLAYQEITYSNTTAAAQDGVLLDYFTNGQKDDYIAYLDGVAESWATRSPKLNSNANLYYVVSSGTISNSGTVTSTHGIRPALVLHGMAKVEDDGTIIANTAPTITSTSGASGADLGTKNDGFDFSYTVSDDDGDTLTITETLDGVTKRTFTAASGSTYSFEAVNADNFRKVLNGTHTLSVVVSDGTESVTFTATFTKSVTSASITLASPLTVEGDITLAVAAVTGSIPDDADYTFEVTNNANDTTPVWQDVTAEVKNGGNIVFENTVCENGAAFNVRLTVKRGASGTGGYIEGIAGAFQ